MTVKFFRCALIFCCFITSSVVADECSVMLDAYVEELKSSLDERVDYSKPQAVSNSVRELEFIETNRNLLPDCELTEGILIVVPPTEEAQE